MDPGLGSRIRGSSDIGLYEIKLRIGIPYLRFPPRTDRSQIRILDPGLRSTAPAAGDRPLRAANPSSSGLGRDPDTNASLRPPVSVASGGPLSGRRVPAVATTSSTAASAASSAASPGSSRSVSGPDVSPGSVGHGPHACPSSSTRHRHDPPCLALGSRYLRFARIFRLLQPSLNLNVLTKLV